MNKIVIPALLVATVMVAGAFAFLPVEQASTIHTTTGAGLIGETETFTIPDGGSTDTHLLTLTFSDASIVHGLRINVPTDDTTDDYDISAVTANTLTVFEDGLFSDPGANTDIDIDWIIDTTFQPITVAAGNTIVITLEEDDTTDGADQTATIDVVYSSVSGATVTGSGP